MVNDPKEIAEHLMLIDLGRNDVGRVAKPGTVKVTEQFGIEKYSHVMHMVSNVEADLDEGLSAIDLFKATFPAGKWKDGKYNGQGTVSYANGNKYVGKWKDGKYNGHGTETSAKIGRAHV